MNEPNADLKRESLADVYERETGEEPPEDLTALEIETHLRESQMDL
jgi:hypothetical protein